MAASNEQTTTSDDTHLAGNPTANDGYYTSGDASEAADSSEAQAAVDTLRASPDPLYRRCQYPSRPAQVRPDRAASSSARPRSRSTKRRHGRESEGPADEAAATPPQCIGCGARNPKQLPEFRITNEVCRSCRWIESLPTRIRAEWSRYIQEWEEMPHEEVPDVRTMTLRLIDEELLEDRKSGKLMSQDHVAALCDGGN